jgi:hypothetical protein
MTATINWVVSTLERDTATGYVRTAHWRCDAVDGDFSGSVYASCGFDGELSIPYDQLTEATVLSWVWEKVDKEATEAAVLAQINAARSPVTASGVPWAAE